MTVMRMREPPALELDALTLAALVDGHCDDPFAVLGPHSIGAGRVRIRCYLPQAEAVDVLAREDGRLLSTLQPLQVPGLYAGHIGAGQAYRLRIRWPGDSLQETEDPYAFGPLLSDFDLYLIGEGSHRELGRCLGAQALTVDGVPGVRFAVWAPNARRVSVVGDFNSWDGRRHSMRVRRPSGVWEIFVPHLQPGSVYKYEILGPQGLLPLKADPVALQSQVAPMTASIVAEPQPFAWTDDGWLQSRRERAAVSAPLSIYEVHAGSWRRRWDAGHSSLSWDELGDQLIAYVAELGFTHIELLPVMSHPFGGSWGYQPLGLFAPQASFGTPDAFRRFVDRAHQAGIGVILDWVPAHFPTDEHGLARFDGTALYEHEDPREGFHQDWNTLIYNLGRREVHGFMLASALHWIEHYHIDGLRVDAVASMLYRDYSRQPGEWIPNRYGGRENLENVDFLRHLNTVVGDRCPGVLMIAEESTAWPGVTRPAHDGGLGFTYKWNMGWMHDTLHYMRSDPVHRRYHHNQITFGLVYAFSEHFVLPLSHDEVVHGKGSLIGKMPGDDWQRYANLRAYYAFMWSHPGKKLLFMGGELAQQREWDHDTQLDWAALRDPRHAGMQRLIGDLNRLYRETPALHKKDGDGAGFHWLIGDDAGNSVFAYVRYGSDAQPPLIAICNFTPVPRNGYRVGVPRSGRWREVLNTDSQHYDGSGSGNLGMLNAAPQPSHGQPFSVQLMLPPLAVVWLRHEP
ncbi:1,4-alpha-glucan branching protein GlgB [Solimonas marina]